MFHPYKKLLAPTSHLNLISACYMLEWVKRTQLTSVLGVIYTVKSIYCIYWQKKEGPGHKNTPRGTHISKSRDTHQ